MIKTSLKYYAFLITTLMSVGGFMYANTISQLIAAIIFYPVCVLFYLEILPKNKKAITLPEIDLDDEDDIANAEYLDEKPKKPLKNIRNSDEELEELAEMALEDEPFIKNLDIDRRAFIKLIGSAGISVFMLSLFTKRAEAAFFGSVPGPGTVAIKDSSGNQIDPAEKHPTDGYRVSQLDDSTPAYYGFTNKDGAWFILREDASGNYRYSSGASSFSTNWTNRASLSYDYYENVF